MFQNSDEEMKVLSGKTALLLALIVVIAPILFAAFGAKFEFDTATFNMIRTAFLAVIYFYWRVGKNAAKKLNSDRRPLILHVEDEPLQQDLVREGLNQLGLVCDVIARSTAEEAWDCLMRTDFVRVHPDAIILDIVLKGKTDSMTGTDFLRKIKTEPSLRLIPVVIFSAYARDDVQDQAALETCQFYIDRQQGIRYLKDAVAAVMNQNNPFEDLNLRYEEEKKKNHVLRTTCFSLIGADKLSSADRAKVVDAAKLTLSKNTDLSGRWSILRLDQ